MSPLPDLRPFRRRIAVDAPYDFEALLAFYAARALPGVERVDTHRYARTFGSEAAPGWFSVRRAATPNAIEIAGRCSASHVPDEIVARVRRMFDLDADPIAIAAVFGRDRLLRRAVAEAPGLRVPGAWDGFELAVRAILGQQVTVAAARTQAARLVARFGRVLPEPLAPGLDALFPAPSAMLHANRELLGMPQSRADALATFAQAVHDGQVRFDPSQPLDAFVADCVALRGIGDWTAHYIAMRALALRDAFPAGDLILRRAANPRGPALSERALRERSQPWRPYRSYAVLHLWRMSIALPKPERAKPAATKPRAAAGAKRRTA